MLYEAIILAVIAGWIFRGRISNLARLKLTHIWLVFAAFAVQLAMDYYGARFFGENESIRMALYAISYLMLFIFLLLHREWPGASLLTLGFLLNFAVIMLNGGAMPSTINGLDAEYVRLLQSGDCVTYTIINEGTKFPWMADIMIFPWPKAKAFSVGDIFISVGVFWLVFKTMRGLSRSPKLTSVRGIRL